MTRHKTSAFTPVAKDTRVAIYVRVSSTMQVEEGFSLDAQLKACRKFSEDRDWHVVEVYEEPGVSAKDDNRPAFQRMIRAARADEFDVILTHKLDRFSRSILDVLTYLRDLNEWGVSYVSATENFDFSTPMGKMQLHIMAALAQWYLDNLSQEITKGKKARAEAGFWNGNLPFGYRSTDARTIEIDENEAEGVRLAFRLCATGAYNYVDIAKALNDAGYRTHGKSKFARHQFTKYTARDLLHNKFYLGLAKYRRNTLRRQFDFYPGKHAAIIDQSTWDKAQQAIRASQRRRTGTKLSDRVYPLTGLAICAECGSPFRGQSARQNTYYLDSGRAYGKDCKPALIPAHQLEGKLVKLFAAVEITEAIKAKVLAHLSKKKDAGQAERKQAALSGQLERIKRLFQLGDISEAEYLKERARIEQALAQLNPVIQPQIDLEEAARLLTTFGATLAQATASERKVFYRTVLEQVVVKNRQVVAIRPKPHFYDLLRLSGVRPNGFEPSQPQRPLGPQPSASANSATGAKV